jgi:hypothetical protein
MLRGLRHEALDPGTISNWYRVNVPLLMLRGLRHEVLGPGRISNWYRVNVPISTLRGLRHEVWTPAEYCVDCVTRCWTPVGVDVVGEVAALSCVCDNLAPGAIHPGLLDHFLMSSGHLLHPDHFLKLSGLFEHRYSPQGWFERPRPRSRPWSGQYWVAKAPAGQVDQTCQDDPYPLSFRFDVPA